MKFIKNGGRVNWSTYLDYYKQATRVVYYDKITGDIIYEHPIDKVTVRKQYGKEGSVCKIFMKQDDYKPRRLNMITLEIKESPHVVLKIVTKDGDVLLQHDSDMVFTGGGTFYLENPIEVRVGI